jgi:pyroglutamyl-peptidase
LERRKLTQVRVLLTAFEPYDQWVTNSSWLALVEMLKDFPVGGDSRVSRDLAASGNFSSGVSLVTRRYPVDLHALHDKLKQDLLSEFDVVLHLGQSPGASSIKLEAIALNAAGCLEDRGAELDEIVPGGPVAYRSGMPLSRWASLLRDNHIPAAISYHAGTFLCNAIMYLSHHELQLRAKKRQPRCKVGFVHLPLATEQVASQGHTLPSLPLSTLARAVRLLVEDLQGLNEQAEHVA